MNKYKFDLTDKKNSYLFGFIQADGHLSVATRNRGKLVIKIGSVDSHILHEFKKMIPFNSSIREEVRDTNFKLNCHSTILSVYDWNFRTALNEAGIPYGAKSKIIKPPSITYSKSDYWRGILDGDGSVGITSKGRPFISLITSSEPLAEAYFNLIEELVNYRPMVRRNTRDGVYNIMITNERAQTLIKFMYENATIGLNRKMQSAIDAMKWKRPASMKIKEIDKSWTEDEINYLMQHSNIESMSYTNRTENAVKLKRYRTMKLKREAR